MHLISCDMPCVTPCHVSNDGMRRLQYIMLTTFTNHKSLFSLKEISARSKLMRCFQYVCVSLSSILSLGNVRWWTPLMCFATIALMFLSTECVASSISRWLGCKAEYYLLSCSTHSVLRLQRFGWMVGIRRPFLFNRFQHKCMSYLMSRLSTRRDHWNISSASAQVMDRWQLRTWHVSRGSHT